MIKKILLCLLIISSNAFANTLRIHSLKVTWNIDQKLENITTRHCSVIKNNIVGAEMPGKAHLEGRGDDGHVVFRIPLRLKYNAFGLYLGCFINDNGEFSLYNFNGKKIVDLMGSYDGGQIGLLPNLLVEGASIGSPKVAVAVNRNRVVFGDARLTVGLGVDISKIRLQLEPSYLSEVTADDEIRNQQKHNFITNTILSK